MSCRCLLVVLMMAFPIACRVCRPCSLPAQLLVHQRSRRPLLCTASGKDESTVKSDVGSPMDHQGMSGNGSTPMVRVQSAVGMQLAVRDGSDRAACEAQVVLELTWVEGLHQGSLSLAIPNCA